MALEDDIRQTLIHKPTEELLHIWTTNDRLEFSDIAFELISEILAERGVELPPQEEVTEEPVRVVADDEGDEPLAADEPRLVLRCVVCGSGKMRSTTKLMNSRAMTFVDLDFLDDQAHCLICRRCGFVHWFLR